MFRNLFFFRFPAPMPGQFVRDLDRLAPELALKPVGPMELSSRGWVQYAPATEGEALPYVLNDDTVLLTLGGEDKILPPAVVNAELAKRVKAIEEAEGRRPGGRTRKRLKDEVITDLLPRALVKPYRLDGYLDLRRGLLVVDTASRKAAEDFASHVRRTLGSFPALPLNAEVPPCAVLTDWLDNGPTAAEFRLGDECQLRDVADHGGVVSITRMELQSDEVEQHLEAGKRAARLGLEIRDRLSFTLGEDLVVRKLRFLDGAMDDLAGRAGDAEDLAAEIDARATLLVGEVGKLFDTLEQAFKLSKVEG